MIKQVSAVVIFAALIGMLTWPGEAQQRIPTPSQNIITASTPPVFDQSYTAGMRIIHVPQPGAASANDRQQSDVIEDEEIEAPVPQSHKRAVVPPQPRRVLPPANMPKRTMLSPPKSLHDGPSPIRPLPRWRGIEKFTELPKQVSPLPAEPDPISAQSAPIDSGTAASADNIPVGIDDDTPPPAN